MINFYSRENADQNLKQSLNQNEDVTVIVSQKNKPQRQPETENNEYLDKRSGENNRDTKVVQKGSEKGTFLDISTTAAASFGCEIANKNPLFAPNQPQIPKVENVESKKETANAYDQFKNTTKEINCGHKKQTLESGDTNTKNLGLKTQNQCDNQKNINLKTPLDQKVPENPTEHATKKSDKTEPTKE